MHRGIRNKYRTYERQTLMRHTWGALAYTSHAASTAVKLWSALAIWMRERTGKAQGNSNAGEHSTRAHNATACIVMKHRNT